MRFLADESCDFAVVHALRSRGHDVLAVAEVEQGADDERVIELARSDLRVLITEDKDFGQLTYATTQTRSGVIFIRYPVTARSALPDVILKPVSTKGDSLLGCFATVIPGKIRINRLDLPTDK